MHFFGLVWQHLEVTGGNWGLLWIPMDSDGLEGRHQILVHLTSGGDQCGSGGLNSYHLSAPADLLPLISGSWTAGQPLADGKDKILDISWDKFPNSAAWWPLTSRGRRIQTTLFVENPVLFRAYVYIYGIV